MSKIIIDYRISGTMEVEIDKERLERLEYSMKNMKNYRQCIHVQDEFVEKIEKHIEEGRSNREVLDFGIEVD